VALSANGASTSASSVYSPSQGQGYSAVASEAINGDRTGTVNGTTAWWNDGTQFSGPDWLQVDFNGSKTIDEVDVFTAQDNYTNPSEPTEAMTFSAYGWTEALALHAPIDSICSYEIRPRRPMLLPALVQGESGAIVPRAFSKLFRRRLKQQETLVRRSLY
jgi:hypothetical protein